MGGVLVLSPRVPPQTNSVCLLASLVCTSSTEEGSERKDI